MEVQTLAEQALFATVRIEADTPQGGSTGTAFIFTYEHGDGREWPFLVTNKHVVADATTGRFFFIKGQNGQPVIGQRYDFQFPVDFNKLWHGHPNADVDITVTPVDSVLTFMQNHGMHPFFKSFPSSLIPTPEQTADLDAVEDVMFIGYPPAYMMLRT